ncbi:MAG TPA: DEAD/DEAH box helicase [Gemmatimonadaceae bacterium]
MGPSAADYEGLARTLGNDPSFLSEAAQVRARATLTDLLGEAPRYHWTYIAPRMARNLTGALFELERIAFENASSIPTYSAEALRYAYAWESLAALGEAGTRRTDLLNAAASYDLAGYEANAVCIARRMAPLLRDRGGQITTTADLAAAFLQRLFVRVLVDAEAFSIEPDAETTKSYDLYQAAAGAVFARGLRAAAHAFLAGDANEIDRAGEFLALAEKSYVFLGFASQANLSRLMRSLLPVMWQRSTWVQIGKQEHLLLWQRYLKLLARGTGRRIIASASVSELWPSQLVAVKAGLLASPESRIVRMPTSAGKTRIAELAMVNALLGEPGAKCIYVAPYRALVSEVEETFGNLLSDLGLRVTSVLGSFESDDFERLMAEDADLIVLTPEKLDLFLRLRSDFLTQVRLIVLDEGHIVDDLSRGAKYELMLTRLKIALGSAKFLVLSAVVPDQTLQDFAKWLGAGKNGVISSKWRPSVQRIGALEWRGGTGVLRYERDEHSVPGEFVPGIIEQRTYEFINDRTGRVNRRRFPQEGKSQVAAELAFVFADVGSVLVFATLPRNALAIGRALLDRLELMRLTNATVPSYFVTPNTRAAQVAAEWLGESHQVTNLLRNGIAVHHGGLPDAVRSAIEVDCRERRYKVLAATSTLAQGVNLPIRTVIFHSCWRGSETANTRMTSREYWNIAGRAGRASQETEGTVIHLVSTQQDERDYANFLANRDSTEPVESTLLQALKWINESRFSEEALGEALDAEVLAIAVEEVVRPEIVTLDNILNQSLLAVQAGRQEKTIEPVRRALKARRQQIIDRVPSADLRATYSATGLCTDSCESFREHVLEHADELGKLLPAENLDERLTGLLFDAAFGIEEMNPNTDFPGDARTLLQSWLAGSTIEDIRTEYAPEAQSIEDLTQYIEDLFVFRLPWGFAAYLRIAAQLTGIEHLGIGPQFLPAMVKFGVPFPEAAWGMTAGLPTRRLAISFARDFFVELRSSRSRESFLDWLAHLEIAEISNRYDLSGPLLDIVARALRRMGRNQLLIERAEVDAIFPITVPLRGVSFGNRRFAALNLTSGGAVRLVRDYDNVVDQNAIRVLDGSEELGFLPRDIAQVLAPEIDTGLKVQATVTEIRISNEKIDPPRIELSISRITRASGESGEAVR